MIPGPGSLKNTELSPLMGSPAEANLEANFLLNLQFECDLSIQKSVLQDEREDKKYKLNLAQEIY